MRIVGGTFRGRRIQGPKSKEIRPALDKVKQAIFNILGNLEGKKVIDFFAGTGSIGLEALSRGAAHCTFVDSKIEALRLIEKNIRLLGLQQITQVIRARLPKEIGRLGKESPFDLLFVDPPYDKNLVNPTLRAIAREKLLAPGGTVVVEHSPREVISPGVGLTLYDQRKYGQTYVSFLRGKQIDSA
jgi:16S rRNA (guanine966-N2)-methyltransferase